MPFKLNILNLLTPRSSKSSTTQETNAPAQQSTNHLPHLPEQIHTKPTSPTLSYTCLRSHILITKLSPIAEVPPTHSTTKSATISPSPALYRKSSPIFPLPPISSTKFQYYLPHLSTTATDFYTTSSFVAFESQFPPPPTLLSADLASSPATSPAASVAASPAASPVSPTYSAEFYETVEGVQSLFDLPYIAEGDFEYYPREGGGSGCGSGSASGRQSSEEGEVLGVDSGTGKGIGRESGVSVWSGRTLISGGDFGEGQEGKRDKIVSATFGNSEEEGKGGLMKRISTNVGVVGGKGKRLRKKKDGEVFFFEKVVRRWIMKFKGGKGNGKWKFRG